MRVLAALALFAGCAAAQGIPPDAWSHRAEMTRSARVVFGPGAPTATLAAQIQQESAWRTDAVSRVGAQGLAQFMPATAADMAARYGEHCAPANPFSPRWAFACRDRYMRAQLKAVGQDALPEVDAWAFALRAYNGGLGWIRRDRALAAQRGTNPNDWHAVAAHNAGRSAANFRENTEYPIRIFRLQERYRAAGWGRAVGGTVAQSCSIATIHCLGYW